MKSKSVFKQTTILVHIVMHIHTLSCYSYFNFEHAYIHMIFVLAVANIELHAELVPERTVPLPGRRSDPLLLVILLITVTCYEIK